MDSYPSTGVRVARNRAREQRPHSEDGEIVHGLAVDGERRRGTEDDDAAFPLVWAASEDGAALPVGRSGARPIVNLVLESYEVPALQEVARHLVHVRALGTQFDPSDR